MIMLFIRLAILGLLMMTGCSSQSSNKLSEHSNAAGGRLCDELKGSWVVYKKDEKLAESNDCPPDECGRLLGRLELVCEDGVLSGEVWYRATRQREYNYLPLRIEEKGNNLVISYTKQKKGGMVFTITKISAGRISGMVTSTSPSGVEIGYMTGEFFGLKHDKSN